MNGRFQTWFPFNVQICLNGREGLAQQLRRRHSDFKRADNCFTWLANPALAQDLMDQQLDTDWPAALRASDKVLGRQQFTVDSPQRIRSLSTVDC
jgi:hypothetical protein